MTETLSETGGPPATRRIALNEFNGYRYLEIEEWYVHRPSGEHRKKKGISINAATYQFLKDAMREHDERIMNWIGKSYVPESVTVDQAQQHVKAERLRHESAQVELRGHVGRRNESLAIVSHEGGKDVVSFNTNHPFWAACNRVPAEFRPIIARLLQALARARIDVEGRFDEAGQVIMNEFSLLFSRYLSAADANEESAK